MRKRALIVEADAPLAACLVALLRGQGIEADIAADAGAVLERLRVNPAIDFAMLDTRLDGLALCEAVRADPYLCRCRLVVTGPRGRAAMALKARALGVDAYLAKPFSPDELLAALDGDARG